MPFGDRRAANLPDGNLHVLFPNCGDNIFRRQANSGHTIRVQPDAHAVIERTHVARFGNTFDTRYDISHIDRRVVRNELGRQVDLWRMDVDNHEHVGRLLAYRDALAFDLFRQQGLCLGNEILHPNLRHIRIRAEVERDVE